MHFEAAANVLCIAAESADGERLFSAAGRTITKLRTSLAPDLGEAQTMLFFWLRSDDLAENRSADESLSVGPVDVAPPDLPPAPSPAPAPAPGGAAAALGGAVAAPGGAAAAAAADDGAGAPAVAAIIAAVAEFAARTGVEAYGVPESDSDSDSDASSHADRDIAEFDSDVD